MATCMVVYTTVSLLLPGIPDCGSVYFWNGRSTCVIQLASTGGIFSTEAGHARILHITLHTKQMFIILTLEF